MSLRMRFRWVMDIQDAMRMWRDVEWPIIKYHLFG